MSDFEMLSIVLSILSIILMILIAYINETKKSNRHFHLTVTFN